ncbi:MULTISPECIES: TetR/AcrR family transcriptional regulator [unclassified Streptomyces]|uniref:TetR/AcrR family transcriptional regulator n=1 Tax=unclassified Streptomyces TaxID=2593676 RepID=UPI0035D89D55
MTNPAHDVQQRPPQGRPRDERIDTAVPRAVLELLAEAGYSGLTMDAVATRARTSKPALRRRWRSKQHLAVDALVGAAGTFPTPDTGCTHCDLIEGITTLSETFSGAIGRRVLPALVADLADDPELDAEFRQKFFHPRRASTAAALRRGIQRGDLKPDTDVDLLLDMLAATTYYRVLFGHLPITDALAEDVVMAVLTGAATDAWRTRQHG